MRTFVAVFLLVLLAPDSASAQQSTSSELEAARAALSRYDVEGDSTLAALRKLGSFVTSSAPADQRLEARYLRAMASADLLIVSTLSADHGLPARLAQAIEVAPEALIPTLETELVAVTHGIYADAARNQLASLRAASDEAPDFAAFRGARRDALYVRAAATRLEGAPDALAVLSTFGSDPCAGRPSCDGPTSGFTPKVRAALAGVDELRSTVRRISTAIAHDDVVSAYVANDLILIGQAIASMRGDSSLLVPSGLSVADVASGAAVESDLVVVVAQDRIRYGFLPRLRFDESRGSIGVYVGGAPAFPALAEVPFTSAMDNDSSALPEIVTALASAAVSGRRVSVTADPNVSCRLVSRVIRSVRDARADVVGIAGRTPDGVLRTIAIAAPSGEEPPRTLFVRLSGYDFDVGRAHASMPRVRDGTGFRYDVAALGRLVGGRTFPSASVRFMGGVPFGALAGGMSRLVVEQPVQLFVPR